jgi:hypothetical protein
MEGFSVLPVSGAVCTRHSFACWPTDGATMAERSSGLSPLILQTIFASKTK